MLDILILNSVIEKTVNKTLPIEQLTDTSIVTQLIDKESTIS